MRLPLTYSLLGPTQKLLEQALQGQGWGNLFDKYTGVAMVRKMGKYLERGRQEHKWLPVVTSSWELTGYVAVELGRGRKIQAKQV